MAAIRQLVNVYDVRTHAPVNQIGLPAVFSAPIRRDVVHFVHTNMAKNRRQPYAVSEWAGHQHSAESWGTGRAVARIPRVSGSGTHRAGQGAFGNMCRKGRMFAPTKIWRRWHRKVNLNQRRYATASALAASAVPALVMARGHRINKVDEIPLVLRGVERISKTKEAVRILTRFGANADAEKVKRTKKVRAGKGKGRNRRYVLRRGPLVVHAGGAGVGRAFRNITGVEVAHVDRLNLLKLAPGGHMGRFIVWTEEAFKRLEMLFGTGTTAATLKSGYMLPRTAITNADIARIINSTEVQSSLRKKKRSWKRYTLKKSALRNVGTAIRLNPYTLVVRRSELKHAARAKLAREARLAGKRKLSDKSKKERADAKKKRVKKLVARAAQSRKFGEALQSDDWSF